MHTIEPLSQLRLVITDSARFYRFFYRAPDRRTPGRSTAVKGYVAKKGNQFYAVIYEGLHPVTGKEKRTWHPAGPDRPAAEKLASKLAAEIDGRDDKTRSLTFGAYLTEQWLPGKANTLAESTWHGYRRKIDRHILPTLGRIPIRRLKATNRRREGARPEDGARDPPHHPRRPRRCGQARHADPQRRHRRPGCGRFRSTRPRPGPPTRSPCSCGLRSGIGCSRRSGWPPTPACVAANSSA